MTDDLPTPPLPDATSTTLVVGARAVSSGRCATFQRALAIAEDFSSCVISVQSSLTWVTPGSDPTRARTSRWICARSGQPAVVRAMVTMTLPSGSHLGALGHAELDDVAAELGVDHAAQGRDHLVGGRERRRGHAQDSTGRPCKLHGHP